MGSDQNEKIDVARKPGPLNKKKLRAAFIAAMQEKKEIMDEVTAGMKPYLSEKELKTRRIALINCEDEEGCGFAVEFTYPNCTFFYCKPDKWGVNVDLTTAPAAGFKCRDHGKMERYDLLEEDNMCPICENNTLAILSSSI